MRQNQVLKVSEFLKLVNQSLSQLGDFIVEGEISGFHISKARYVYFNVKDEESVLPCFLFLRELKEEIEEGMLVKVWGRAEVFPPRGNFTFRVFHIEPSGEGALKRALQLTMEKLEREGIFSESRKRVLPRFPQRIGLIASKESAAYSDFLKVLKERWGGLEIYLADVQVQGMKAPEQIISAFDFFNKNKDKLKPDVIVLIRGGGSLEDLAAFNNESVARAVFSSETPVICGVGHEKDWTLAGYAADLRASTPSNAAELLVRRREEVEKEVRALSIKLQDLAEETIRNRRLVLEKFLSQGELFFWERRRILDKTLEDLKEKLFEHSGEVSLLGRRIEEKRKNLLAKSQMWLEQKNKLLGQQVRLLESLSPKSILKRGYSVVKSGKDGRLIREAGQLKIGELIEIILSKGELESEVVKINK